MRSLLSIIFILSVALLICSCGDNSEKNITDSSTSPGQEIPPPPSANNTPKVVNPKGKVYTQTAIERIAGAWIAFEDKNRQLVISKEGDFIRMQGTDIAYSAMATLYEYNKCPADCTKGEEMERGIICMKLKDESGETCYWIHELDLIKLIYTEAGDNKVYEYRRVKFN